MDKKITVYTKNQSSANEAQRRLDKLKMLLRLVIGGSAETMDELMRRVQEQQQRIDSNPAGGMTIIPHNETDLDRLRYALLGLLFETPDRLVSRISSLQEKTRQTTNRIDSIFRPFTNSFLVRPVRRRYKERVAKLNTIINDLIDTGRTEAMVGRRLARDTFEAAIDELFDYVAQNPELRQIVQQQSIGMTEEVVDQLRDRAASADMLVDRIARTILRRGSSPAEVVPPDLTKHLDE
ncbi:MAG: hypothetical protein KDI79_01220 [Anaerolineae bacterium]|nr:hypothetical protein [Anaerolineae bacterium]